MIRIARVAVAVAIAGAALWRLAPAHAQQAGTIKITSPANGATVSAPITVTVAVGGVTVKPAAEGDPDAYHYHVLVDVDPATVVQAGQPIPTGQANIIHTADPNVPLSNLAPGTHIVTVILTKTNHVPLTPSVQDRVQFTVAAAGAGVAAPPRVGTGIANDGPAPPRAAMLLAITALAGGALVIRRRRAA